MARIKGKKAAPKTTIKVSGDFLVAFKNEQNRIFNAEKRQPSQSEMADRMWQAYVKAGTVDDSGQAIGSANQGVDISKLPTNKSQFAPINRGTTDVRNSTELLEAVAALEQVVRALREIASIGGVEAHGESGADSRDPLIPPEEFARDRERISARVDELERAEKQIGSERAAGTGRTKRGGEK